MACLENVGNISLSLSSSGYERKILWTIPKFYDLPQEANTVIKSPRFHLGMVLKEWQIEVYPNGYFCESPPGWLGISIVNSNRDIDKTIITTIGIGKPKNIPPITNFVMTRVESHDDGRYSNMKFLPTSFLKSMKESLLPEGNLEINLYTEDAIFIFEEKDFFVAVVTRADARIFFEGCAAATRPVKDVGVEKLTQDFKELLRNGNISDFVLKTENKEFKAHKCVLAARSPVFMGMMQHETKEKLNDSVDIQDVDAKTVEEFLTYLYTGGVDNLNSENVMSLYKAADKYQVNDLKKTCLNHMMKNVSVEGFCDVLALSLLHEEKELKEICIKFFLQNSLDIVLTSKWQTFLTENPIIGNELFVKHLRFCKDIHKS